jgi:hypothetical protein
VSDADGANEVRIILGTSTLDNFHPEWSPDGTRIAFVQISSGRKALRIRNANGTIVSVPMTPGLIDFRHPTWLSNTRLALSARNSSSVFSIYAINTDGSNLVRLAQGTGLLGFEMPVASPDGSKIIVYRSTSFNAGELLMMNGDGTGLTTIRTDARPMRATWSPDGSRYAFVQVGATPMTDYALISVLASSGADPRTIKTGFFGTPSWGPRYEFATTGGTNVLTAAGGASVRFTSVNPGGGTTTFTPVSAYIGLPPEGYATGSRGYEIFTTAAYSSPVTVCIKAPQSAVPTLAAFNASTLMHREGTLAVDRTTSRNFATREICGETPNLGQFALGQSFACHGRSPAFDNRHGHRSERDTHDGRHYRTDGK